MSNVTGVQIIEIVLRTLFRKSKVPSTSTSSYRVTVSSHDVASCRHLVWSRLVRHRERGRRVRYTRRNRFSACGPISWKVISGDVRSCSVVIFSDVTVQPPNVPSTACLRSSGWRVENLFWNNNWQWPWIAGTRTRSLKLVLTSGAIARAAAATTTSVLFLNHHRFLYIYIDIYIYI